MTKDPVCGMRVDENTAKFKSDYAGTTYYFCNDSCKAAFDKNPQRFTSDNSEGEGSCCCC